jgi:hypothetical protein
VKKGLKGEKGEEKKLQDIIQVKEMSEKKESERKAENSVVRGPKSDDGGELKYQENH